MSRTRKAGGTNRTVIQLTDENYLSVFAALTPPGEPKPPHGVMSKFFNQLVEAWRVQRATEMMK